MIDQQLLESFNEYPPAPLHSAQIAHSQRVADDRILESCDLHPPRPLSMVAVSGWSGPLDRPAAPHPTAPQRDCHARHVDPDPRSLEQYSAASPHRLSRREWPVTSSLKYIIVIWYRKVMAPDLSRVCLQLKRLEAAVMLLLTLLASSSHNASNSRTTEPVVSQAYLGWPT